jgi:hypothetical protein
MFSVFNRLFRNATHISQVSYCNWITQEALELEHAQLCLKIDHDLN